MTNPASLFPSVVSGSAIHESTSVRPLSASGRRRVLVGLSVGPFSSRTRATQDRSPSVPWTLWSPRLEEMERGWDWRVEWTIIHFHVLRVSWLLKYLEFPGWLSPGAPPTSPLSFQRGWGLMSEGESDRKLGLRDRHGSDNVQMVRGPYFILNLNAIGSHCKGIARD